MRAFFRRIRGRRRANGAPTRYRATAHRPLWPSQVRQQRFPLTRFGRRGLDPQEVQEFLSRVAGDLAAAYDALAQSRDETHRVKEALRRWQSEQATRRNQRCYR